MSESWDVAFGRMASARGWVDPGLLRQVYASLPPGRSLGQELVARGALRPDQAQAIQQELLRQSGVEQPSAGAAPAGSHDATVIPIRPGGASAPTAAAGSAPTAAAGSAPMPGSGAPAAGLPAPGEVVDGRFQVLAVLGKGGMGAVYRARDASLGAEVALKIMLPGLDTDGRALARFQREAEAVAQVDDHEGIVRVRAAGVHRGMPYCSMDLVEGRDLKHIVREQGPLAIDRALEATEAVARAIQHCHDKGILHRDLKPANILVRDSDGAPFVTDFGLALDDASGERLTVTGESMGTPAYMSPEQADGNKAEIDHLTDVYALGAILYELVTGRPPFQGDAMQIIKKVFMDLPAPVPSLREDAPAEVDVICMKAMAKEKASRYSSASALADDMARLRRGEPIEAKPIGALAYRWWRLRQRPGRNLAIVLCILLLVAAGVLVPVYRQRYLSGAAREALAQDTSGWLERAEIVAGARSVATAVAGVDDDPSAGAIDTDATPSALLDYLQSVEDRLAAGDGLGLVEDDDLVRAQANLETLRRRLGLIAGGGEQADGDAPPSDDLPWEDRFHQALLQLGWLSPPSRPLPTAADIDAARTFLETSRDRSPAVTALDRLRAVEASAQELLPTDEAKLRAAFVGVLREERRALDAIVAAWASASTEFPILRKQAGPLSSCFEALVRHQKQRLLERCYRLWAEVITAEQDLSSPAIANRLSITFLDVDEKLESLINSEPALAPEAIRRSRQAGGATILKALLAKQGGHYKALPDIVSKLRNVVDWSDESLRKQAMAELSQLFGMAGIQRGFRDKPDPELLVTWVRVGGPLSNVFRGLWNRYVEGSPSTLERYLKKPRNRTGAAYLTWAMVFQGDARGRDFEGAKATARTQRLIELYGRALGDDLEPDLRRRLGLEPAQILVEPLPELWRAYARSKLGIYVLRLARHRERQEATPVERVVAGAELLEDVERDADAFPRESELLAHCVDGGVALEMAGTSLQQAGDPQGDRLRVLSGELLRESLRVARARYLSSLSQKSAEEKGKSLAEVDSISDPEATLGEYRKTAQRLCEWNVEPARFDRDRQPLAPLQDLIALLEKERQHSYPPAFNALALLTGRNLGDWPSARSLAQRSIDACAELSEVDQRYREQALEWRQMAQALLARAFIQLGERERAIELAKAVRTEGIQEDVQGAWDIVFRLLEGE